MTARALIVATLLFLSQYTLAGWQLDKDASEISFVSVKKSNVAETHHFRQLSGEVDDTGKARLSIDLASVETNIPIRNERMQTMLFETGRFPSATITATVDTAALNQLEAGQTMTKEVDLTLSLHGEEQKKTARIQITGLTDNRVMVSSLAPIVINADKYKLHQGIEKLRKVAGLDAISPVVPVTFKLVFVEQ